MTHGPFLTFLDLAVHHPVYTEKEETLGSMYIGFSVYYLEAALDRYE